MSKVNVKVFCRGRRPVDFEIGRTENLSKMMMAYAEYMRMAPNQLIFRYHELPLYHGDTANSLSLENGAEIDVTKKK